MPLPNFFIIGAAKAGTSSLYMYLKQHPQIFMSPIKEPHFFSYDSESKHTRGPGDPIHKAITELNDYQALFSGVTSETMIGEASTSYLYRPEAPGRIHAMVPQARLIAVLRNPVERAFSAYMHVVRDQRETAGSFAAALALEDERRAMGWEPIWHFTRVGRYHEQLSRYFALFDPGQIKIVLYEDLIQNQTGFLRDIFTFLQVDPDFNPVSVARFNVSGEQKSTAIYRLTRWLFLQPNPIRWLSRRVVPEIWRGNVASWIRQRNLRRSAMPAEVRAGLVELFRDEVLQLQDLIHRDLSSWLV